MVISASIVSLTLELEDCDKAVKLLQEALDKQQERLNDVLVDVGAPLKAKLEEQKSEHHAALASQLSAIDELVSRKRALSEQARRLIARIEAERAETAAAADDARAASARELEAARNRWGEGSAARREAFLARDAAKAREMTLKGLEPEVERIMDKHKAELARIENDAHAEEKRLRERAAARLSEKLQSEKQRLRESADRAAEAAAAAAAAHRRQVGETHETSVQRLKKRLADEVEEQRRLQEKEIARSSEAVASAAAAAAAALEERRRAARLRAAEETDELERKHSEKMAKIAADCAAECRKWQKRIDDAASTSPETSEGLEFAEDFVVGFSGAGDGKTNVEEEEMRRLAAERDRKIDEAVRRLQKETAGARRAADEQADAETARLRSLQADEVGLLRGKAAQWARRQAECSDGLHALATRRRALSACLREAEAAAAVQRRKREREAAAAEKRDQAAIEAAKATAADVNKRAVAVSEKQARDDAAAEEAQRRLAAVRAAAAAAASAAVAEHEDKLRAWHDEVRRQVADADQEAAAADEQLQIENLKIAHATKTLSRYAPKEGVTSSTAPEARDLASAGQEGNVAPAAEQMVPSISSTTNRTGLANEAEQQRTRRQPTSSSHRRR